MKAKIFVSLKDGVLDPQGKAVQGSLARGGYGFVKDVRIGKAIELEIDEMPKAEAIKKIEEICEKLLANTVMENYKIEIAD